jgi:hypothetical protein
MLEGDLLQRSGKAGSYMIIRYMETNMQVAVV